MPLDAISPNLQHAIVAIEDRRFYHHPGIDIFAIVRALWINLQAEHIDQGGSTLEEQLVKRAIVHDDSSLHAKLRTMALAWAVDQEFGKRRILEMYLNAAYYGQGAYGVDAAAHVYFGTDPAHLTLSQAAFLAALPQAPSVYGANPTSPMVIARQRTVLQDMENQGYISAQQEQAAERARLTFAFPNP
jgi:penicillin-binding protein 1A